jgi:hypothetical protein
MKKRELRALQDRERLEVHRSAASARLHRTVAAAATRHRPLDSRREPFLVDQHVARAREPHEGLRRHKLLPVEIQRQLPPLRSQDKLGLDAVAVVKFFCPYQALSRHVYIIEGERNDEWGWELFGMSVYYEQEFATFSFKELAELTVFGRVPAWERDCYWSPRPLRECEGVSG